MIDPDGLSCSWCGAKRFRSRADLAAHEAEHRAEERIVTSFIYPPIPIRSFDWSAHLDSYDGAPDAGFQPVGHGATEAEAIADLKQQIEDHDA